MDSFLGKAGSSSSHPRPLLATVDRFCSPAAKNLCCTRSLPSPRHQVPRRLPEIRPLGQILGPRRLVMGIGPPSSQCNGSVAVPFCVVGLRNATYCRVRLFKSLQFNLVCIWHSSHRTSSISAQRASEAQAVPLSAVQSGHTLSLKVVKVQHVLRS